jgi:hypothetical protein
VSVYQWPGPWLPKPATVIAVVVAAAVGAAVTAAVLHATPSRAGTPTPCTTGGRAVASTGGPS